MFIFEKIQLRVVSFYAHKNRQLLSKIRLIILEHILPTTVEFVRVLESEGAEVFALSICNSI